MKIVEVKIHKFHLSDGRDWVAVEVVSDDGRSGWGDHYAGVFGETLAAVSGLGEALIGKDIEDFGGVNNYFHGWKYPLWTENRTYQLAWSSLDQAIWDLRGQLHELPLYKLYGAYRRKDIPLYANLNNALRAGDRSPEALARNGAAAFGSGFKVVKATPFDEINPDTPVKNLDAPFARLKALAKAVPFEKTAVDCHCRFEMYTAARVIDRMKDELGLPYWLEDPVNISDTETMTYLHTRYPEIRWAAAENTLNARAIYHIMDRGQYEILMPDVNIIGGPTVLRTLIPAIEGCGFKVSMHNPAPPISTAHSAHLMALALNIMPLEFPYGSFENRPLLTEPKEPVEAGVYHLSDRPGLGVRPNPDLVKDCGTVYHKGEWK